MDWLTKEPLLEELRIEITHDCMCDCSYCYLRARKQSLGQGTLDEVIVKSSISEACGLGLRTVSITGGEPLIYADYVISMIKWIKMSNLKAGLLTNGLLITEELSAHIAEAGLDWVRISVDSVSDDIDLVTAHCWPSNHLRNIVSTLCSNGIDVILRATVSRHNAYSLHELVRFVAGQDVLRLELQPYFPYGNPASDQKFFMSPKLHDSTTRALLWLRRAYEKSLDIVLYSGWFEFLCSEYRGERIRYSKCGRRFLFLDRNGWFRTCGPSHRLLMQVQTGRSQLGRLWLKDEYLIDLRDPQPKGLCIDCDHFADCRFWCPATNTVFNLPPNYPIPVCPKVMAALPETETMPAQEQEVTYV